MDEFSVLDGLYAPALPSEPFLLTIRKKLNFFFNDTFMVSFDTFNRIVEDYRLISEPDFGLGFSFSKSSISVYFYLLED